MHIVAADCQPTKNFLPVRVNEMFASPEVISNAQHVWLGPTCMAGVQRVTPYHAIPAAPPDKHQIHTYIEYIERYMERESSEVSVATCFMKSMSAGEEAKRDMEPKETTGRDKSPTKYKRG